jgi:hypothetical protein
LHKFYAEYEPGNSYQDTLNQNSLDYNYNLSDQTRGNSNYNISELKNINTKDALILKNQSSIFILGNDLRPYDKSFSSENSSSSSNDVNNQFYDNSYEPKISKLSCSTSDFMDIFYLCREFL